MFWLKGRFLFLKCLVKVFINKFYFIAGLENEEKLVTWTTKSTKLLISLRREKAGLFDKGKVRKKVAWDKVAKLLTMPMHRDTLDIVTLKWSDIWRQVSWFARAHTVRAICFLASMGCRPNAFPFGICSLGANNWASGSNVEDDIRKWLLKPSQW